MAIGMDAWEERAPGVARAAAVLVRAALGLFVHGLAGGGRAAVLERSTGRVRRL